MVNTMIVSRYAGDLPLDDGATRKIAGGPLYPADQVLGLVSGVGAAQAIVAWTKGCASDMQKWSLDAEDVCEMIRIAMKTGRFLGSEWCTQRPDGPWAACDVYSLARSEWIANAHKEMNVDYYIKFAISKTGKAVPLASVHPSGS